MGSRNGELTNNLTNRLVQSVIICTYGACFLSRFRSFSERQKRYSSNRHVGLSLSRTGPLSLIATHTINAHLAPPNAIKKAANVGPAVVYVCAHIVGVIFGLMVSTGMRYWSPRGFPPKVSVVGGHSFSLLFPCLLYRGVLQVMNKSL